MTTTLTGNYRLISEGEWESAGFTAPFPALSSLALHAVKRGFTNEEFRVVAHRAGSAVRRNCKGRAYGEKMASKAYFQAVQFAKSAPRGGSSKSLQRWVEASALWVHRFRCVQWRGRGSANERKVLAALTERALKAHSLTVNGSLRLLAEETLIPRGTVSDVLDRLVVKGFVTLTGVEGHARVVSLCTDGVDVFDALEAVYGSATGLDVEVALTTVTPSSVFDEVWARKCVNRHHGFIHAGFKDSGLAPVTTRGVADSQGLTLVTARRHLNELKRVGLVKKHGRTWSRSLLKTVVLAATGTTDRATGVPTAGLRERFRLVHARERFEYERMCADKALGLRVRKVIRYTK